MNKKKFLDLLSRKEQKVMYLAKQVGKHKIGTPVRFYRYNFCWQGIISQEDNYLFIVKDPTDWIDMFTIDLKSNMG